MSDARRFELEREAEGSERVSPGIRAWRVMTMTLLVAIPLLFAIDGLVFRIGILYEPASHSSLDPISLADRWGRARRRGTRDSDRPGPKAHLGRLTGWPFRNGSS